MRTTDCSGTSGTASSPDDSALASMTYPASSTDRSTDRPARYSGTVEVKAAGLHEAVHSSSGGTNSGGGAGRDGTGNRKY
jgi:hypothetical protein